MLIYKMSSSFSSVIGDQIFSNLAVQKSIVSNTLNSNVVNVNTLNAPLINSGAIDTLGIMANLAVIDNVQSLTGAFMDLIFENATGANLDVSSTIVTPHITNPSALILSQGNNTLLLNSTGISINAGTGNTVNISARDTSLTASRDTTLISYNDIFMTSARDTSLTASRDWSVMSGRNINVGYYGNIVFGSSGRFDLIAPTHYSSSYTGGIIVTGTNYTQSGSTTTTVATHNSTGSITTLTQNLGTGGHLSFTATNERAFDTSLIQLTPTYAAGYNGIPVVSIGTQAFHSFDIVIRNAHTTDALNGPLVISYFIYNTV